MKISVLIPAYNCEATIRATLDSVLAQTCQPDEILVMDDGSTDQTASLLNSYVPRINVLSQRNGGVASARNALCERVQGDLLAFIDADNLWHPHYLETQKSLFEKYPHAAGFSTGYVNFRGYSNYIWAKSPSDDASHFVTIPSLVFFKKYNEAPSTCEINAFCVPKRVLKEIGDQPFGPSARRSEDFYFTMLVALHGDIIHTPAPLVAYRLVEGSLSCNRVESFSDAVRALELLEDRIKVLNDVRFTKIFRGAIASKRRVYAKLLLGAGRIADARKQLRSSLWNSGNPFSIAKSLGLFFVSYLPHSLQPTWPSSFRDWKSLEETAVFSAQRSKENR